MEISPVLGSVLLVIFLANRVSAEDAPRAVVSIKTTSIPVTPLNANESTLKLNNNSTNATTTPITQTAPVPVNSKVNSTASIPLPAVNRTESSINSTQATITSNKTLVDEKVDKTSLSTTSAGSSAQSTSMSTTTLSTTTTAETSTPSMTTAKSTSTEAITTTAAAATTAAAPTAEKVDNKAVNDPNLDFEQKPPESNPKIIKSEIHMEQNGGSSHFFVFACIGLALCIGLYLAYQSRSKLLAFLIEGRRPPRGRSRQSSGSRDRSKVAYRPLNSNVTQESTNKGFIY